jgi:hypothetical protein
VARHQPVERPFRDKRALLRFVQELRRSGLQSSFGRRPRPGEYRVVGRGIGKPVVQWREPPQGVTA